MGTILRLLLAAECMKEPRDLWRDKLQNWPQQATEDADVAGNTYLLVNQLDPELPESVENVANAVSHLYRQEPGNQDLAWGDSHTYAEPVGLSDESRQGQMLHGYTLGGAHVPVSVSSLELESQTFGSLRRKFAESLDVSVVHLCHIGPGEVLKDDEALPNEDRIFQLVIGSWRNELRKWLGPNQESYDYLFGIFDGLSARRLDSEVGRTWGDTYTFRKLVETVCSSLPPSTDVARGTCFVDDYVREVAQFLDRDKDTSLQDLLCKFATIFLR